jgi:LemA protein
MDSQDILVLVGVAVFGFWAVGAYNRLVRLRNGVARAFGPLDLQIAQRHALMLRWTAALRPVLEGTPQLLDATCAAAEQLHVATEQARLRPTEVRTITSLRLAEDTLAAARTRLLAEVPAHLHQQTQISGASLELAGCESELAAVGSTLAFARRQFNEAADRYNEAVLQFPTVLIASLFGFGPAGVL